MGLLGGRWHRFHGVHGLFAASKASQRLCNARHPRRGLRACHQCALRRARDEPRRPRRDRPERRDVRDGWRIRHGRGQRLGRQEWHCRLRDARRLGQHRRGRARGGPRQLHRPGQSHWWRVSGKLALQGQQRGCKGVRDVQRRNVQGEADRRQALRRRRRKQARRRVCVRKGRSDRHRRQLRVARADAPRAFGAWR